MKRSNVVGFRSGATGSHLGAHTLPSVVVKLRDATKQRVAQLLRQLFNSADDALFAMADKAGSNGDQTHYFDAMRELRLQKKQIATEVVKGLISSFDDVASSKNKATEDNLANSLDDLDLVQKDDMELQVAVEGMVGRVRSASGMVIEDLRCRYEAAIKAEDLAPEAIPASPEVICDHFVKGIEGLDVSIRARLVILKLFEQHVLTKLTTVYEEANETLVKQGILPDLKLYQRVKKSPPIVEQPTHTPDNAGLNSDNIPTLSVSYDSTNSIGSGSAQTSAGVHDLSALLHAVRQSNHSPEPPVLPVGNYSQADIVNTLSNFQSEQFQSVGNGAACEVIDFRSVLNARLAEQKETTATFNEIDEDVINLVSMLFEFILDDHQLQPVMKASISRLQIPILKVALLDRSFFSKGGHPARQLLNLIASAALGWTEAPAGRPDHLRNEIEAVIDTVLKEFEDRVELFSELLDQFKSFLDKEERRRLLIERRISDSEQGKAANEVAQQKVQATIEQIINQREVPDCVQSLVQEGLSRSMLLSFLKSGEDSVEWKKSCRLVEDLVWSVVPSTIDENTRTALLGMIPKVVNNVRQTLKDITFDDFRANELLTALETEHIKTLGRVQWHSQEKNRGQEPSQQASSQALASPSEHPEAIQEEKVESESNTDVTIQPGKTVESDPSPKSDVQAKASDSESIAEDPFLMQVDKLTVGCWFELNEDERSERCKLAAVIKITGKFIFVNRSGVKVAERTREELAIDLRQGKIQVLNDGLLFDRALESVITSLRDQH